MSNLQVTSPINVTAFVMKSDEKAIRLLAQAGFEAYDASVNCWVEWENPPYQIPAMDDPAFLEYARHLKRVANEVGIACNSAHGPCASGAADPMENELCFRRIIRCMEAAALMGAQVIVVHPICYMLNAQHREELMELNVALYRRLMPYAEKFKIKVAAENLIEWGEGNRLVPGVCGSAQEVCQLMDRVASPWMTFCMDFGHASCAGVDVADMIRKLGKERLGILHVHDNDLHGDQHSLPFLGKIDYTCVVSALREIKYDGILDLEVDISRVPEDLVASFLKLSAQVGMQLKMQVERGN